MAASKRQKLNKKQSKKVVPYVKQFNSLAKIFIESLERKIQAKQRRINKISILIEDIKVPESRPTIDITTVDMRKTKIKKKGEASFNQVMSWEDDYIKQRKKWII